MTLSYKEVEVDTIATWALKLFKNIYTYVRNKFSVIKPFFFQKILVLAVYLEDWRRCLLSVYVNYRLFFSLKKIVFCCWHLLMLFSLTVFDKLWVLEKKVIFEEVRLVIVKWTGTLDQLKKMKYWSSIFTSFLWFKFEKDPK